MSACNGDVLAVCYKVVNAIADESRKSASKVQVIRGYRGEFITIRKGQNQRTGKRTWERKY